MVATLLQHCNPKLRWKSSLQIAHVTLSSKFLTVFLNDSMTGLCSCGFILYGVTSLFIYCHLSFAVAMGWFSQVVTIYWYFGKEFIVEFISFTLLIRNAFYTSIRVACEQVLLFGRVKRVSRERASETRFACPNRRACSQATIRGAVASPQTSFGVGSSRIHLSPTWRPNPKGRLRGG